MATLQTYTYCDDLESGCVIAATEDEMIQRMHQGKPTYEYTGSNSNTTCLYFDYDYTLDETMSQTEIETTEDTVYSAVEGTLRSKYFAVDADITVATCHRMTKKGFKFSMRFYVPNIRDRKDKQCELAKMLNAKLKDDALDKFDTGVYGNNRKMRCIGTSKPGEDAPLMILQGEYSKTLITKNNPDAFTPEWIDEPITQSPKPVASPPTKCTTEYDAFTYWLENGAFTQHAENYPTWMSMGFALRSTFGEKGRELFHKFSILSKKYERDTCDAKWDEICNSPPKTTFGSIVHWAQQGDKTVYAKGIEILHPKTEYAAKIQQKYRTETDLILDPINELGFRDMVFDLTKGYLMQMNGLLYLYFENEWISTEISKPYQLRHLTIEIFNAYIQHAYALIGKLEGRAAADGDKDKKKELRAQLDKLQRIKTATYVKNITSLVIDKLMTMRFDNINFDVGKEQAYNVHFKNGVYDLQTQTFRMRTETDFITKWLNYDYQDETEIPAEILNYPEEFFRKIHADETHREFCIAYNAYCITGDTTKQIFKMNQGRASNGKSTEYALMTACFPIYVQKMDNRILSINFEKRHKYLHCLTVEPVRLIYMEELPPKNLDVNFIKDFVDGRELEVEVMHGTKAKIICNAKLATCSQHDPKMDVDEGIIRRGVFQKYTSTFLENVEDDWENRTFNKVFGFENIFLQDDRYKLAMFHTLRKRIGKMVVPKELKDEFKAAIEDSDEMNQMLHNFFEFSPDQEQRMSKAEVMEILGNPPKAMENDYMTKLKLLCTYKSQSETCYKGKKVKGRFFGISQKLQNPDIQGETDTEE